MTLRYLKDNEFSFSFLLLFEVCGIIIRNVLTEMRLELITIIIVSLNSIAKCFLTLARHIATGYFIIFI